MMLNIFAVGAVLACLLLGFATGVRARAASLAGTLAAVAAFLLLANVAGEAFAPLSRVSSVPMVGLAAIAAVLCGLLVSYVGQALLVRRRRPRLASRLAGAAVGALQGAVVALVGFVTLAAFEPDRLAAEREARAYRVLAPAGERIAAIAPAPVAQPLMGLPAPVTPQPEPVTMPPRPVSWTELPQSGGARVERIFTGTVRAGERAPLAFEVGGRVTRVMVRVGETVAGGDPIAEIDDTTLRLAAEERRSALVETEAVLREAQATFERKRILLARRVESEAAVDNARAALESAQARTEAARSALARAEEALDDATLTAPYGGRIATQLVEPSEVVAAGAPVFEIEDAQARLEVVVDVPEAIVNALSVGQSHELMGAGPPTAATITEIGSRRANGATFPVTLEVANADDLRPGATRRVALGISLGERAGVLVPSTAVVAHVDGTASIYRLAGVDEDGVAKARRYEVDLLAYENDSARIATDLPAGTAIAARGAAFLTDGQRVALLGLGVDRLEEFGAANFAARRLPFASDAADAANAGVR